MAGTFTKQATYLGAKYLNDVNDSVVGGQIQTVPSSGSGMGAAGS